MLARLIRTTAVVLASAMLFVSLAQAPDTAARVVWLTGQVSVLRDGNHWALDVGNTVQPKQVIITGPDGSAEFRVADGSTFQVFPNSQVTFRANGGSLKDLLDMMIGRVKVQIQKLGKEPNPNNVKTPTAVISVRGTVFDVVVDDGTETTYVSVEEGLVEVRGQLGDTRLLHPGEAIYAIRNQPLARNWDKGAVARGIMRAAMQAIQEIIFRAPRGGGSPVPGGSGGIGGAQGDKTKPAPPTDAPPPPPPPPPQ